MVLPSQVLRHRNALKLDPLSFSWRRWATSSIRTNFSTSQYIPPHPIQVPTRPSDYLTYGLSVHYQLYWLNLQELSQRLRHRTLIICMKTHFFYQYQPLPLSLLQSFAETCSLSIPMALVDVFPHCIMYRNNITNILYQLTHFPHKDVIQKTTT